MSLRKKLRHDGASTLGDSLPNSRDSDPRSPSQLEIAALFTLGVVLFITAVAWTHGYYLAAVDKFGDSSAYMGVASALRRWDFHGIVAEQFWGLPYAMAALSKLTGVSDRTSLLVFSLAPSLLAVMAAWRLWGGWIAGYFAVLNFDWMQRSCLGGSEPLFVCLLLATFLAVRRQRWLPAALLASLATIVRPLGLFALIGVGLTLLWNREYRKFAGAFVIGITIGVLYVIPLKIYFGDPLATVHGYHNQQWRGGHLFGIPFAAILQGTSIHDPWTSLVLSFGWIFFIAAGVVAMVKSREFRAYCRAHTVEACFLVPYLWCLFTYNYPYWARGSFARFAIPVLPFVLLVFYRWLPKDRRILWGLGVVSALLAAVSALGLVNVVHMLRTALG